MATPRHIRRRSGSNIGVRGVIQRQAWPVKVMLWGCFSSVGPGTLYMVAGSMKTANYIEILEEKLLPQAQQWFGGEEWFLLQDYAPCHTSKATKQLWSSEEYLVFPGHRTPLI